MRITVSPTIQADPTEVRRIVRFGFDGVADSARIEVHVKGRPPTVTYTARALAAGVTKTYRSRTRWDLQAAIDRGLMHGPIERFVRAAGYSGRAYSLVPTIARVAPNTRRLVTIHMPVTQDATYPKTERDHRAKSMPEITLNDWREDLLRVAAHEAFHVRQFQRGWSCSEVEAERAAKAMLNRWRRHRA